MTKKIVFGQGDEQLDEGLNPGIGGTSFKVTFKENWISKKEWNFEVNLRKLQEIGVIVTEDNYEEIIKAIRNKNN